MFSFHPSTSDWLASDIYRVRPGFETMLQHELVGRPGSTVVGGGVVNNTPESILHTKP